MKICTKCNKEIKSSEGFCTEDGGKCVEKPASTSSPTSAQKIMAGGDITQNVSHHSETKVYNQDETKKMMQCVVSGRSAVTSEGAFCRSCNEWAHSDYFNLSRRICKNCEEQETGDKENIYRTMVAEFLGDDHILDPEERKKLDLKAEELGLASELRNRIESQERSKDVLSLDEQMTPRDKSKFKRAHDAFYKNGDPKAAFKYIDGLQDAYSKSKEVAELFSLIAVEVDPAKGLSFLNQSPFYRYDSALKSIRLIELHESMGNENDASNEERNALRIFGSDRLVQAKSLERLIDLYYEDQQEQDQADDVKMEAGNWQKPEPSDDPYVHFVQAYLENFLGERVNLVPKGDFDLATPFLLRKQRQLNEKVNSSITDLENIEKITKLIGQVEALNDKISKPKAAHGQAPRVMRGGDVLPVPEKPINGQGKFTFKSGDTFEGEWKNGGIFKGNYHYANGVSRYEGEYNEKAQCHGQGKFTFKNGDTFEGEWENGKSIKGNYRFADGVRRYEGERNEKGQWHGQGKFWYGGKNVGDTFEGEWKNGKAIKGNYRFADGVRRYEGERNEKGQWHGQGKFTHANGNVREGLWTEGEFVGKQDPVSSPPTITGNNEGEEKPKKKKSRFLAVLLTFFFWPLGLFYISFKTGLLWTFLFFVAVVTLAVLLDQGVIADSDLGGYWLMIWAFLIWEAWSKTSKTQK